ncbi:MAG: HDOD domain-containing protein, partial [Myxococcales bacterium]|nr:HDOD domain-containing protein [Myxococcales bacterium]
IPTSALVIPRQGNIARSAHRSLLGRLWAWLTRQSPLESEPPDSPPARPQRVEPQSQPTPSRRPQATRKREDDRPDEPAQFDFEELAAFPREERVGITVSDVRALESLIKKVTATIERSHHHLPPFPAVALEVMSLVHQPDVAINELVRLVNQDQALTVQLLRVANSAYFSRGEQIKSARQAIVRLGMRETAMVISASSSYSLFRVGSRRTAALQSMIDEIWLEGVTNAFGAVWFAMETQKGDPDLVFLAGMLHDIGKSIALRALMRLVTNEEETMKSVLPLAPALLEAIHVDAGVGALVTWNMPTYLVEVCRNHHLPARQISDPETHLCRIVSGINRLRTQKLYPVTLETEVRQSCEHLGITPNQLRPLAAELRTLAEKSRKMIAK